MKKRYLMIVVACVLALGITGCEPAEEVPEDTKLEKLENLSGNSLEKTHDIDGMKLTTTYSTGDYDLKRWRITDSKVINMSAKLSNIPEGATVLIEHVHTDISLKSKDPQLDGLAQDSMDDSYHGTSQDGFFVNDKYEYENTFAIEGFSKELMDGWLFVTGSFGAENVSNERLTEENLIRYGEVYANKMQVIYDVLVKYEGEEFYHVESITDEFLIPVKYEYKDKE